MEERKKSTQRKKFKWRIPKCCIHVCEGEQDFPDKLCCSHDCGEFLWPVVEIDGEGRRIHRDLHGNRIFPNGVT